MWRCVRCVRVWVCEGVEGCVRCVRGVEVCKGVEVCEGCSGV